MFTGNEDSVALLGQQLVLPRRLRDEPVLGSVQGGVGNNKVPERHCLSASRDGDGAGDVGVHHRNGVLRGLIPGVFAHLCRLAQPGGPGGDVLCADHAEVDVAAARFVGHSELESGAPVPGRSDFDLEAHRVHGLVRREPAHLPLWRPAPHSEALEEGCLADVQGVHGGLSQREGDLCPVGGRDGGAVVEEARDVHRV